MHVSVKNLAPGQVYTRGRREKGRKGEEDPAMQSHRLSIAVCTHGERHNYHERKGESLPRETADSLSHAVVRFTINDVTFRGCTFGLVSMWDASCSFWASSSLNPLPRCFLNGKRARQNTTKSYCTECIF